MDRQTFESEIQKAKTMARLENSSYYWTGYQRGLRRNFHGESFGTKEEHLLWMDAVNSDDEGRKEEGRGYQDGLAKE